MYFREVIEEKITNRLLDRSRDVCEVPDTTFNQLLSEYRPIIKQCVRQRHILGFDNEDLESFCVMKMHQLLRRGQLKPDVKYNLYFMNVFRNLFNDINKMKNRLLDNKADIDILDTAYQSLRDSDRGLA